MADIATEAVINSARQINYRINKIVISLHKYTNSMYTYICDWIHEEDSSMHNYKIFRNTILKYIIHYISKNT